MTPRSVTNGQMLRAQFGRKSKKIESLSLLVTATELPGDEWFQRGERAWRMGVLKPVMPWFERAGKAGSFTASRSFEQPSTQTWFGSQVIPLVSEDDASLAVSAWSTEDMWGNVNFHGTLITEQEIHGETVPGLNGVRVVEMETETPVGHGFVRLAMGRIGPIAYLANLSRNGKPWTAEEFSTLVSPQVAKIQAR